MKDNKKESKEFTDKDIREYLVEREVNRLIMEKNRWLGIKEYEYNDVEIIKQILSNDFTSSFESVSIKFREKIYAVCEIEIGLEEIKVKRVSEEE